jgi:hypothetical protein
MTTVSPPTEGYVLPVLESAAKKIANMATAAQVKKTNILHWKGMLNSWKKESVAASKVILALLNETDKKLKNRVFRMCQFIHLSCISINGILKDVKKLEIDVIAAAEEAKISAEDARRGAGDLSSTMSQNTIINIEKVNIAKRKATEAENSLMQTLHDIDAVSTANESLSNLRNIANILIQNKERIPLKATLVQSEEVTVLQKRTMAEDFVQRKRPKEGGDAECLILQNLESIWINKQAVQINDYIDWAAHIGSWRILQWVLEHYGPQDIFKTSVQYIAASQSKSDIFTWLHERGYKFSALAYEFTAATGQCTLLLYLLSKQEYDDIDGLRSLGLKHGYSSIVHCLHRY